MEVGFLECKTHLYFPFPLFLILEPLIWEKIDANFFWEIVTSSAVLNHWVNLEEGDHDV